MAEKGRQTPTCSYILPYEKSKDITIYYKLTQIHKVYC